MCQEHAINAGFAAQLNTVSSLKDVNATALLAKTSSSLNAHGGAFGLDMCTDLCDEQFCSIWGFGTHCKVITLLADWHIFSINCSRTDILLMDCVLKSHCVDENHSDEEFPWIASFRVSFEGTVERENIFVFVQPLTKLTVTPIAEDIINFQEAVN